METERERHLINQNQQLKRRIREIEQLFGETDDEYQKNLNDLVAQKQELKAKNAALESKMFTIMEENAELSEIVESLKKSAAKNTPQQSVLQSNIMSESFLNEYNELQDKVEQLNEEKAKLQSEIRELKNHLQNMVERIESLESTNAELNDALSIVNKEKKQLQQENKRMAESVTMMQMQIDTMSSAPKVDHHQEFGNSLFSEITAGREQMLKEKAESEQQIAVLRRTMAAIKDEERRKSKDIECMRESMKTLSERNKQLQKELERRIDAEAESVAIKQSASMIEKENESLKKENARLKKQFVNAESRADENAHLLSKATVSQSEFYKGIQQQADLAQVHSTPRPILKHRTPSLSRNESIERRARNVERKPSSVRSLSTTPASRIVTSPPKDPPVTRKRGIMLDYSEPVNRRKLDFKVQKLSDNHQRRQLDHLKSHYDSDTGTYDQAHGESPESAVKKGTPRKENRILNTILRR